MLLMETLRFDGLQLHVETFYQKESEPVRGFSRSCDLTLVNPSCQERSTTTLTRSTSFYRAKVRREQEV